MATKIVGLDLGAHTVKVCELVTTFRNFELVGFGSEPVGVEADVRPSFADIAAAARRLLDKRGLQGETLMCALTGEVVSTTTIEFPFDKPKLIEATLPFQLDDVIPYDVEDVVWDYQIIEHTEAGGCIVLVSHVKEAVLADFLGALLEEGIDPKTVSIGALSYFNLYDHTFGEGTTTSFAVLDLGHTHNELVLFDQGHPVLARDLPGAGRDVTVALAAAFDVDAAQAEHGKVREGFVDAHDPGGDSPEVIERRRLVNGACTTAIAPMVREVQRALIAQERTSGRPVEALFLTGGGSQLRGMAEYLEQRTGLKVSLLDPLSAPFNRLADGGDRLRPYIARALALSMHAFHRTHQSLINFRKGQYAYTGDFGFLRGRIITLGLSVLMIIVLGAMVAVSKKRVLEAEYQTLNGQVQAVSMAVLGYETDDIDMVYAAIVASERKQVALLPETSALELLSDLSDKIGFDLVVDMDKIEIDIDRKNMKLSGKTGSGGDLERMVDSIRKTKCFKGKVSKDRVERSLNDKTKFRLTASMTCG